MRAPRSNSSLPSSSGFPASLHQGADRPPPSGPRQIRTASRTPATAGTPRRPPRPAASAAGSARRSCLRARDSTCRPARCSPGSGPTRIGVPPVTSVLPASRCPPHTDTTAIIARVAATRSSAWRARRERRPPRSRHSRMPRTATARRRRTALASCATGSSVIIVLPSGIHGKPPNKCPRTYSSATHAGGASNSPAKPNAANEHGGDRAHAGDEGRHVEHEQAGHEDGDRPGQSAEGLHGGAGPVDRAGKVDEAGDQAEHEAAAWPSTPG